MKTHQVMIAGAGPTGMMLAGELALADVDVAIVERRTSPELAGSRAGGLHARTIEVLDQRGIAERFLAQGQKYPFVGFAMNQLDISDFPTRHPYVLALRQKRIERTLAEWIGELKVPIYRGREVTGIAPDEGGVDIELSDGERLRAQYLVGCDGGRSVVRKAAGIDFPGWDATMSWLIAEADTTEPPAFGFRQTSVGTHAIGKVEEGGQIGVVLTEPQLRLDTEPTLRDVSEALVAAYGTDFGIHNATWVSRFTDATRQAATYRKGRVLLAGDAAHIHPPMGGQGLNIGVQDAVNLGWKLAQVVKGTSSDDLLDTYHAERHPIGARVLKNTMAQVALGRTDDRTKALREYVSEFLAGAESRKRLAAEMSGLGVHYDLGEGHPLLGRRMPDLELMTSTGNRRLYELLSRARPVLLNLGEPGTTPIERWRGRVQSVDASFGGAWELPSVGTIEAPTAVLIRPDGYAAWVGDTGHVGLTDALTKWFGSP